MQTTDYLKQLLDGKEEVLFVTRQHWLVLVGEIASEAILTIALIVLVSLVLGLSAFGPVAALGYLLLVFPLISLTRDVLIWRNRQYIVTNRRIIQVAGVLQKDVTDSSLEKVNDVKMEQSALGRMLDYGDIEILTASETGDNLFKRIGDPIKFKTAMLNSKEKLGYEGTSTQTQRADDIPAQIAELDKLRKQGIVTEAEFQAKKKELLAKM